MVQDNRDEMKCPRLTQEQRDYLEANPPVESPLDPDNIFYQLLKANDEHPPETP
jgi:hypothetical protein